jgi:hypothetical protein
MKLFLKLVFYRSDEKTMEPSGSFRCFMKTRLLTSIFVAAALLCGCASTSKTSLKFTDLHDSKVFPGKGGEQTVVDGVDFWLSGEPDREYRILGMLDFDQGKHGHGHGRLSGMFSSHKEDSDPGTEIAEAAKKNGGDAIVVVQEEQRSTDTGDFGSGNHRTLTRYVVVKYLQ